MDQMEDAPVYRMVIDLNVLNHLGLNLYSNVAAVLSEAVANSWDADSPKVWIDFDDKAGAITIRDEGSGMTIADANERFLKVGYSKRKAEGSTSPGGRPLMGRKGIGKLSLFSIANRVTVVSRRASELHGFEMSVPGIEAAIAARKDYLPTPVPADELTNLSSGTLIRLSELRRRATRQTVNALRKRIARRFSVLGGGFSVYIDDQLIGPGDRDDLSKAQFVWEFDGSSPLSPSRLTHAVRHGSLPSALTVGARQYSVTGWIGSARLPRDLETPEAGNLNSIFVLARGRLIQENILDRVNVSGLFTKYLTGQIEANFLDLDDDEDIATSDRQRVIEDDPRYEALLAFLRETLNRIEPQWAEWRAEIGTKEVVQEYPRLAGWIDSLPRVTQKHARRVIGSIQGLAMDDEEKRRELLRHGLMAFERLRLEESTEQLAKAMEAQPDELLPLIGEQDQFEASLYLQIVRSRLDIISRFTQLVDENAKEKVLQTFLFDHLWLLDASWERAAGSERMEERVQKEFESIDADLTPEERAGRLDIKYRTMAGKHVIIELKRYSVMPSAFDLGKQGGKYIAATRKLLAEAGRGHEPIEIVFVLGARTAEPEELRDRVLAALPGRVRTYEQLIQGAIASYAEFVEQQKKVDAIENLLKSNGEPAGASI